MRASIKSEVRKLLTTRSAYGLLAGMIVLAGPGILMSGDSSVGELSKPIQDQVWYFVAAGFTRLLVVVLGIRAVTDEFRHGTIVPSLLASPDRRRLLAAKAAVLATAGLVFTVLAEAVMVGVAGLFATAQGAELTINSGSLRALVGMATAGALWAVIGVAIGALLRHQVPAIVGSILWLMPGGGLEDVIRDQLGRLADYLPSNAGLALALAPEDRALWWGAAVMLAYAAALFLAGTYVMTTRDATS